MWLSESLHVHSTRFPSAAILIIARKARLFQPNCKISRRFYQNPALYHKFEKWSNWPITKVPTPIKNGFLEDTQCGRSPKCPNAWHDDLKSSMAKKRQKNKDFIRITQGYSDTKIRLPILHKTHPAKFEAVLALTLEITFLRAQLQNQLPWTSHYLQN